MPADDRTRAAWSLRERADGIGVLTLDVPGDRLNLLSNNVFRELETTAADASHRTWKGMLVLSAKPDAFVAGADVSEFATLSSAEAGAAASRAAQSAFQRIASLPYPSLALVHGPCLGGGLELALACRWRVATDDPGTSLAAPEVQLGILPGAGGLVRLPRLIGLRAALDVMASGRRLDARRALRIGLVDAIIPAFDRERWGAAWLHRFLAGESPATRPGGLRHALLDANPVARIAVCRAAERAVIAKTRGLLPAPLAIVREASRGRAAAFDRALEIESRAFGQLVASPESRALVHLFFATTEAKKDTGVSAETARVPLSQLGIVGGGFMGAGIASVALERGLAVRIRDPKADALLRARASIHTHLAARGRHAGTGGAAAEGHLTTNGGWEGFAQCEIVIEAVVEDLRVKRQVLTEFERCARPSAVFATNTSAIPIAEIAATAKRPGRIVGMHFFSPVAKMPLVEVIAGPRSDPDAVAAVVALARRLGKQVIVVRDGPGFYVNRPLSAYVTEALHLLVEGAAVEAIDRAMREAGFPIGPLQVLDEVGWDVARHVSAILEQAFGERFRSPLDATRADDPSRRGRKSGRGFYLYGHGRTASKPVDLTIYDPLPGGRARRQVAPREIQTRLLESFVAEAERCLADGVLRSERDGDLGAVLGLGFPPHLGGPFHYRAHRPSTQSGATESGATQSGARHA